MINLIKDRLPLIYFCVFMMFYTSCGSDYDSPQGDENEGEPVRIMLRLSTLTDNTTGPSTSYETASGIKETVESLRVVMISGEGSESVVELNMTLDNSDDALQPADDGSYLLTWTTLEGIKKFYIFANEGSVGTIAGAWTESLTELLDSFEIDSSGENFEKALASVYFSPEYTVKESEETGDRSVALPYTSYYRVVVKGKEEFTGTMHLVPVATKYDVRVKNYRKGEVKIKSMQLLSLADRNFLMPRVGYEDYDKNGLYWIDWLAGVASESQNNSEYEDNEEFNKAKGWITHYELPSGTEHTPCLLTTQPATVDALSYPEAGAEGVPGQLIIPTFYRPESRNIVSNARYPDTQAYILQLEVEDQNGTVTLSRTLSNVAALFRNSHLVLDIVFEEGYMHIYGEIVGWNMLEQVNGYVNEETD